MQDWDFSKSDNIDKIINDLTNDNFTRTEFLNFVKDNKRIKYLLQSIIDRRNSLLNECDLIHNKILSLQSDARNLQLKTKNINHLLILLNDFIQKNPDLPPINLDTSNTTQNISNNDILPPNNIQNISNDIINISNITDTTTKIKENKDNKENKEKNKGISKVNKGISKVNKGISKEIRDKWFKEKNQNEINEEKLRIINEIKRYKHTDFDNLIAREVISENDGKCKSIKIMEENVLRIKYDENDNEQIKRFHRVVAILKHLENCNLTPRLLYFNANKLSIYLPYYGNIPENTPENKIQIGFLIKKLKRNWGVYRIKDGKVSNSAKPNEFMIDPHNRLYLFDFNSFDWIIDKNKSYPMQY